jgi:PPOX class probable F420-dependent enzyme
VDIEKAREFMREQHRAVMATYKPDGSVQMSPVTCAVDAEGRVLVSTRETAVKTRNLRTDPRTALCVITPEFFGRWLLVEGRAEVVSLPDAMELLVDYYRRAAGEHPDWDEYRAAMERDRRVMVRVSITRAGPDFHG